MKRWIAINLVVTGAMFITPVAQANTSTKYYVDRCQRGNVFTEVVGKYSHRRNGTEKLTNVRVKSWKKTFIWASRTKVESWGEYSAYAPREMATFEHRVSARTNYTRNSYYYHSPSKQTVTIHTNYGCELYV